jgi:SAM-dependent methyltransferase
MRARMTTPASPTVDSVRTYPAWLEGWWIAQACREAGRDDPDAVLPAYAGAVQTLSDLFTVARPGVAQGAPAKSYFPDYGADANLALAYGLFYFPQNFARVRLPLAEAVELRGWRPRGENEAGRTVRVLDLGAGAGAAGLAAAMLLRERGLAEEVELTAVDHSADNLARLTSLTREQAAHLPGLRVRPVTQNALEWTRNELPRAPERFDLIVLGFALNEMLPAAQGLKARLELAQQLRRGLSEQGLLLIIEPALRETAEPLQELSDALVGTAHGPAMPRWGPYLSERPCPLRAEKKFWNHEVRTWTAPGSMKLLNRKLWREIDDVKFSYALHGRVAAPPLAEAYEAAAKAPDGLLVRLVSPFYLRKGGFVAAGVASDGVKYTFDLQVRGLPKEEIRRLEQFERGDVLALRGLKELGTPRLMRLPTPAAITARYHVA